MIRLVTTLLAGWLLLVSPGRAQATCLVNADCSDGNVCTGTEHCVGGTCVVGTALNCNDTNPCTADTCDPLIGCQHAPVLNGTTCSDGNPCNGVETCQAGACTAGQAIADGTTCDDGNKCTTGDACQAGACVGGSKRPDGTQCSDGNPCNGLETCQLGVCTPGQTQANGAPCGDGNPCNGSETCQAGVCAPGSPLPDGALCSDGFVCNGSETCKGQVCIAGIPPANGTSCSDGNVCNGGETCQNQICVSGTKPDCNDGNPCTQDTCDSVLGCRHVARADGASCSDHNPCNGDETCQSGQCTAGTPLPNGVSCSDGNPCNGFEVCQQGSCAAGTPPPNGTACPDGDVCNGQESCHNGVCVSSQGLDCDDHNACTADSCNALLGCIHLALENGAPCDDNDVCNGIATCQNATCVGGAPLSCADPFPSTLDGCDPIAGCTTDHPLAGALLNVHQSGLTRWAIKAKTLDRFSFGGVLLGNGTATDPVLHGASIRVVSTAATDPFDGRYLLPASGWSYIGTPGENGGYRYRDRSPGAAIRVVQLKSNGAWKVTGRGEAIGPKLESDPQPVALHVTAGNQRFCMSFGGTVRYDPMRRFRAVDAPAPASCTP